MPRNRSSGSGPLPTTVTVSLLALGVVLVAVVGTVPVGAAGEPVDVVFVVDRSASMSNNWVELDGPLAMVPERLDDRGIDARYALLSYGATVRTEQGWTADFDEVERAFDASTNGSRENASDAILAATRMDGRDGAERVVVLVTDEDDDSSAETRAAAIDALADVTFLVVSPATASTSSCDVHSPPCDDAESNELRTIAAAHGGTWFDEADDPDAVIEGAADAIVSGSSSGDDGSSATDARSSSIRSSAYRVDLEVRSVTANRTPVEVGEPVAFAATVENEDVREGAFETRLSRDGEVLDRNFTRVPAGENRTVTLVRAFEEPGRYEFAVRNGPAAAVNVTPLRPTTVEVNRSADGRVLTATVADARANQTVSIPMSTLTLPGEGAVSLQNVSVTPTRDADFEFTVERREAPSNGTTALPAHVRPVAYLEANSSLDDDELATVRIEYAATDGETYVYHYDENASSWVALKRAVLAGTAADLHLAGTTDHLSTFAIGVHEPALAVTGLDFGGTDAVVGERVDVTVTVTNRGLAGGTYDSTLRVDGDVVATRALSVPAGETRRVTLGYTPAAAGEHELSVDGAAGLTITVAAGTTPTTAAPTTTTTAPTGQPGFGPGLAAVVLAGVALLARRRR